MITGTSTAVEPREEPDLHLRLDVQTRCPPKSHPPVKRAGRRAPVRRVVTTVPEVLAPVVDHGDPDVVADLHQLVVKIGIVVMMISTRCC